MRKRRTVFVSYGSFGDIHPLLAVAKDLASTHAVEFVTNESYRERIEAAGVPFFAAGTVEEQKACTETALSSGRSMAGLMTQFRTHVGKNIPRLAEYLARLCRDGEAPLVVTHGTINPAFPACEKLGIPVVRAYYAPSHLPLNREDYLLERDFSGCPSWKARLVHYPLHALRVRWNGPPHARAEYNRLRAQVGIGPSHPPYRQFLGRLMGRSCLSLNVVSELLLTPAWFAEPLSAGAERVRCVGFPFYDEPRAVAPQEVEELVARHGKAVVFTPGTGVEDMEEFCRPMESACRKLGVPGVLLARHGAKAFARLKRVLNHPVIHVEYAELARLLTRTRLIVHTGGIGTIAQAVRAGVPQIISPMINDQPRNALRVLLNGLGGMLQGDGYTGAGIARLYQDLAASELHRSCLEQYAGLVRAENGATNAANLLRELAAAEAGEQARSARATEQTSISDVVGY